MRIVAYFVGDDAYIVPLSNFLRADVGIRPYEHTKSIVENGAQVVPYIFVPEIFVVGIEKTHSAL